MAKRQHQHEHVCQVCGQPKAERDLVPAILVRAQIADRVRADLPNWSSEGRICRDDLNTYRRRYVEDLLKHERGELSALDKSVVESIARHEMLSTNVEAEYQTRLTLGERLADKIAEFGGSWRFISSFMIFMAAWMAFNAITAAADHFDPYPFILLNLVLSCLAAIQAPIIMMSQSRQESRDRIRSENDYRVNLKAELEIRHLHEKLDHLISRQWERLAEIQEIQIDLMHDLAQGRRDGRS